MDDMMSMSFANLRISLATPRAPGGAQRPVPGLVAARADPPAGLELNVLLVGPGAAVAARSAQAAGLGALRAREALELVGHRQDFASLEPIAELLARRERVVVSYGADGSARSGAQASSAESLARWLRQRRRDGAGRETLELQCEEPHTRRRFSRVQAEAILRFADAAGAGEEEAEVEEEERREASERRDGSARRPSALSGAYLRRRTEGNAAPGASMRRAAGAEAEAEAEARGPQQRARHRDARADAGSGRRVGGAGRQPAGAAPSRSRLGRYADDGNVSRAA